MASIEAGRNPRTRLLVYTLEVAARARVNLDPLALLDEERHVHGGPRREPRRLGRPARRVALDAGFALVDLEDDAGRELDADGDAVVNGEVAVEALAQEPYLVADLVLHQVDLVAGRRVHEDEAVALVPREGHLAVLDV